MLSINPSISPAVDSNDQARVISGVVWGAEHLWCRWVACRNWGGAITDIQSTLSGRFRSWSAAARAFLQQCALCVGGVEGQSPLYVA